MTTARSVEPGWAAWRKACLHMDGVALGSTVAALHARGVLGRLDGPMRRLRDGLEVNAGYLHGALRALATQGWVTCGGDVGTDDATFTLTGLGRDVLRYADAYALAPPLLRHATRIAERFFGGTESLGTTTGSAVPAPRDTDPDLRDLVALSARGWDLPDPPSDARAMVCAHLDGHLMAPLMTALHDAGLVVRWLTGAPVSGDGDDLAVAIELLRLQGWVEGSALTVQGRAAMQLSETYWYPVMYLPTLYHADDLLFGDAGVLKRRTAEGYEVHIDRRRGIAFNGRVFKGTVRAPFLEALLPLFDSEPLEDQPGAMVDVGCGDASMLAALYEAVRASTLRGRHLDAHPLRVVGADISPVCLETSADTLRGIPTSAAVRGDVNDPAGLAGALRDIGVDPERALYVSKSVIHNRPYVPPSEPVTRTAASRAVFVAPGGDAIPNAAMEQNLVELFRKWRPHARRHGMLVADAHTVPTEISATHVGQTMMTTLDLTHCYSNQYLIEMPVYLDAAREAGLAVRSSRAIGAATLGHDYLSIVHFGAD